MAGPLQRPLLAGNWKMNPVHPEPAADLAAAAIEAADGHPLVDVALFPPFPWLREVAARLAAGRVEVGAQDCYWEPSGAFTGAVSAAMLAGWCRWVIVGHSERRLQFGETDETVARKAAAALSNQLGVILCVGESEEENGAGRTDEVVTHQLGAALAGCAADDVALLAIAYEPVWAIGTGRSADPEHAYKAMRTIRHLISEALGKGAAKKVRVLYGGSVSSENVQSYVELPNCDGCLVGGASLRADEFSNMIRVVAEVYGEGR